MSDTTTTNGLGTMTVTQIGLVVRDIEKSARAYADVFGVPVPPVNLTDSLEHAHTQYRGQPSEARAKLCFFKCGQVSIELIEPVGAPSTWQEFLDTHGEGVHHIAFEIKGMDEKIIYLTDKGVPLIQRGDYTGGRYAYTDGEPRLGVLLELLENFR
ncbi:MAG: VOC family protein [Chloroflexi bacterium]|nr:VOC family protein [Chloroflexota bacterium]